MMRFVASLTLAMALTGCATVPSGFVELPPLELIQDCPTVVESIRTNGELVETILAYRAALEQCTAEKEALREWSKAVEKASRPKF